MTIQSRREARAAFEAEMTEYYEATGQDCLAERSRSLAAELADPDPEAEAEWEAEWADNWDSADSHAYMDRVEAGLEPEAEL